MSRPCSRGRPARASSWPCTRASSIRRRSFRDSRRGPRCTWAPARSRRTPASSFSTRSPRVQGLLRMPTFARLAALRTTFAAIIPSFAAGTAFAQELDIPVVTEAPKLADFVSMEPAEEVRRRYATVSGFTQREPQDGAPSSQRTDVYLGYDSKNLYAVFVAHDDEPESVRANLAPRENIGNDDRVGLLVDTFDDQRTGYGFRSSPLGVQWDARWAEVGRDGFDSSFEAVWFTDAQVTAGGYVVLMTIPFRAMRFPETLEQRWRIQFERLIPRTSEEAYWPAYSQTVDGRLNQAA